MKCTVCETGLEEQGICPRCGADYGAVNAELLRAVNRFEFRAAELLARLVEVDPHVHGKRPCANCKTISGLLSRPFGCERKREQK